MEEKSLLQKIEYLTRKIEELREDSSAKKAAIMLTNYAPRTNSKYWQGQRRIDRRSNSSVNPTLSNTPKGSKYQYKKVSTVNSVARPHSGAHRNQLLAGMTSLPDVDSYISAQVVVPSTNTKPTRSHTNMYINPHFTAGKPTNPSLELTTSTSVKDGTHKSKSSLQSNFKVVPSKETNVPVPSTSSMLLSNIIDGEASLSSPTSSSLPPVNQSSGIQFQPSVFSSNTLEVKSNHLDAKRSIHVNPLIVSSKNNALISADNAKKSVHVNPKVFARLKSEVKREKPRVKLTNTPLNQSKKMTESINKSLYSISRTKLVRARRLSLRRSLSNQQTPKAGISVTKPIPSPLVNIVKSVRSKYKYIRKHPTPVRTNLRSLIKASPFMRTKYTLDRRVHKTPRCFKRVQKYSLKYDSTRQNRTVESNLQGILLHKRLSSVTKSPFRNRVWGSGSFQLQKVVITDQKLFKIGSTPNVKRNSKILNRPTSTSSTLVRIGGILYKTSRTKLTRSNSTGKMTKTRVSVSPCKSSVKKLKGSGGHVVHVRGNKFLMDPSGKTLRRVSSRVESRHGRMKRIDIGGATFIQKSANVLIRTNTHAVRSMLSQAKQKSIDLLTKKMRKNNTVCKFYRRFGKCFREEKGRCPCVHDKKHIAVCKRYLSGDCKKEGCLLSHHLIPEKMPTCKYFLQACCSRDKCPYLHVKLNAKAPLCIAFLQGYCADGLECRKWHFYICPQYDKTGSCTKGKYCPFPHESRKHTELNKDHLEVNVERIMKLYEDRQKELQDGQSKLEKRIRYFNYDSDKLLDDQNGKLEVPSPSVEGKEQSDDAESSATDTSSDYAGNLKSSDHDSDSLPRRAKVGFLPSYIPLI